MAADLTTDASAAGAAVATEETLLERAFALDSGKTQPRDAAAAAALYQAAADEGDAVAHFRLGYLAEIGEGVPQDYAAARAHYQAAVDAGMNEARLRLAICHLEGWGGPVDRPAFVRELQAGAEANYIPAQRILGALYFLGFAVPENRAEGLKWLECAAKLDDAAAQSELGSATARARRLALASDIKLARTWYQLSAEQEYSQAMRRMARTFLTGQRRDRNWELGQRWLEMATSAGDIEAPYVLALCELLHVDAPSRDETKAREWLKLAAERGEPRATEVLELETRDRSLADALKYVFNVPFEDRYVQKAATVSLDTPSHPPVVFRIVRPIYPESLRIVETSGEVLIDFFVDTTGRVVDATVFKAAHPLLGERALESVKQWRFHPARKNGRLVKAHLRVPVRFTLFENELGGTDAMLSDARQRARNLGLKEAADLSLAKPREKMRAPVSPDGKAWPVGSRAMILLALDQTGHPVRGYVLRADPNTLGESLLKVALAHEFEPRIFNGENTESNVVLTYATTADPVLSTK